MRYFGNGETFLFKFKESSNAMKYEWVKKDDNSSDEEENHKKDRSKELFMSADNTMITIGGGYKDDLCQINIQIFYFQWRHSHIFG